MDKAYKRWNNLLKKFFLFLLLKFFETAASAGEPLAVPMVDRCQITKAGIPSLPKNEDLCTADVSGVIFSTTFSD